MLKRICMPIFAVAVVVAPVALPAPPPDGIDILLHRAAMQSPRSAYLSVVPSRGAEAALPAVVVSKNALAFPNFSSLRLPIILDEHEGTGTGYSRLWIDFDGDGKLATNEHTDLELVRSKWGAVSNFTVIVEDGGHRHEVTFKGYYACRDRRYLSLSSMLAFTGSVHVGEEAFDVTVRDGDSDGLLVDDKLQPYEVPAWVTLKAGDTNAVAREFPLAPVIALGNECYNADLSFEGTEEAPLLRMKLSRQARERGAVTFSGSDVATVLLTTSNACLYLDVTNGMVMAPTGTWGVTGIQLTDGNTYRGQISYPERTVTVSAADTARIDAGGPLRQDVVVCGALSSGNLSFVLEAAKGVGGLKYGSATRDPDARQGWIVRRPGGETVTQGRFEYG